MLLKKIFLLFFVFHLGACQVGVSTQVTKNALPQTLANLLQEALTTSYDQIPGVSLSVLQGDGDFYWSGADGFDSAELTDSLKPDQPFRIASVTKTFVAIAILRLHESDSLDINDPIGRYISPTHREIVEQDGYDPMKIKIIHCLNHTSGLFDYAMGDRTYIEICKKNPQKRWTRTEQLEGAMQWGDKLAEPGDGYYYSDTGYILLGEIISNYFGGSLAKGLRTLLHFDALGLRRTWLETLESPPLASPSYVHRYLQREDYTEWDPSIDLYGGGGLVSTTQDLATFMHAVFNGKIFDEPKTLELMLYRSQLSIDHDLSTNRRYKDYRLGVWRETLYGETAYMHNGLWGVQLMHVPELNITVALNFTKGMNDRLLKKTVLAVKNSLNHE